MAKIVSDQTAIWLTDGAALPTPVAVVSISAADPPLVTVGTLPAGMADLDQVLVEGTGRVDLDGKYFQAGAVTGATFTLLGAGAGAAVGAVGTVQVLQFLPTS
jgi:hypothetical protein